MDTLTSAATCTLGARSTGLPEHVVRQALANVADGTSMFLVTSGKLASGKDTVAPTLLARLGYTDSVHAYYALPLKTEIDEIIADLRAWFFAGHFGSMTQRRRHEAAVLIAAKHNFPVEHAEYFTGRLLDQVRMNLLVHARSRTPVIRGALQFHGTEVRRAQDEDYWVKRALRPAIEALAAGSSVYFTDARFPNEVAMAGVLGAFTLRLDVSDAVQEDRLMKRDGLRPEPETLVHLSETSLDDYDGFSLRVDNNGTLEESMAKVLTVFDRAAA